MQPTFQRGRTCERLDVRQGLACRPVGGCLLVAVAPSIWRHAPICAPPLWLQRTDQDYNVYVSFEEKREPSDRKPPRKSSG